RVSVPVTDEAFRRRALLVHHSTVIRPEATRPHYRSRRRRISRGRVRNVWCRHMSWSRQTWGKDLGGQSRCVTSRGRRRPTTAPAPTTLLPGPRQRVWMLNALLRAARIEVGEVETVTRTARAR